MYPTPASTPDLDRIEDTALIKSLNALLNALHIPIPLESPTDLTPSLLIALLESLLATRIPIKFKPSSRGRSSSPSRQSPQMHRDSEKAKADIQSMKVFLGILEHDVLQTDVGLSSVDPRRLAEGEWDEVVFIAELLCWVGRRTGLVSVNNRHQQVVDDREALSPSGSTMTGTTRQTNSNTHYSSFKALQAESLTTVSEGERDFYVAPRSSSTPSDTLSFLPPIASPFGPPRCIHEVPSPFLLLSAVLDSSFTSQKEDYSYCESCEDARNQNTTGSSPRVSVRYTGYIEPVDEDFELASFESSRIMNSSRSIEPIDSHTETQAYHLFNNHSLSSEQARTLELLNERARLLGELAELKRR